MQSRSRSVLLVLLLAVVAAASCSTQVKPTPPPAQQKPSDQTTHVDEDAGESTPAKAPKRIIFMIGDGMGVPAITAATYAKGAPLAMLGMDEMGLVTTHSYDFATTDSAASATALATGAKTHFEAVSVKAGTSKIDEENPENHLETILEKAEKVGWKTGLVATVRVTHATPGAFAGHRNHRHSYDAIALDMSKAGVDVLIGGGRRFFNERKDKKDLLAGFEKEGYAIANTPEAMLEASKSAGQMVALLGASDLPGAKDRDVSLSQMTTSALEVLDRDNDAGFFLMVEGSQIDWRAHALDGEGVVTETLEFDDAIRTALEYAAGRDDTLVVVTADHETGGLAVLDSANVKHLLKKLGGHEKATKMVARPAAAGTKYPAPELLPHIKIGERAGAGDAGGKNDGFAGLEALSERESATIRPAFGHLSPASRALCESTGRFSATHTSAMVPVFAQGAGAGWVAASRDDAVLGARLMALVGAETMPPGGPAKAPGTLGEPTNIILMIGDGMGVGAVTAAYYGHGPLHMHALPVQGLVSTHGLDRLVNDSAATATALSTGRRTNYGALGVVPEGDGWQGLPTLLERSEAVGMRTGLISTVPITHATPAAFYAHVPSRSQVADIVKALVDLPERVPGSDGIDLIYAGGAAHFMPAQLEELRDKYGIQVEMDWGDGADEVHPQMMRLLAPMGLPLATERHTDGKASTPTLAEMTTRALRHLSAHSAQSGGKAADADGQQKGFFLMVEGGQIDWVQHGLMRDKRVVDEVVDFDQAVGAAVDFARRDGNTLVIVTADHDHTTSVIDQHYGHNACGRAAATDFGGPFELQSIPVAPAAMGPACQGITTENPAVIEMDKRDEVPENASQTACHGEETLRETLQGDRAPLQFSIQYAWLVQAADDQTGGKSPGPHSANFVPLFAFGPGAEQFRGFHDQPAVGAILQELVKDRAAEMPRK